MADSAETREVLLKTLRTDVNKRVAVSIYDRFGPSHPLFLTNLEKTKQLQGELKSHHRRLRLRASLESVDRIIADKRAEKSLLSRLDRRKLNAIEELCHRVNELKDDLEVDLNSVLSEATEGDDGADACGPEHLDSLVNEWRVENLPAPGGF